VHEFERAPSLLSSICLHVSLPDLLLHDIGNSFCCFTL
jgi:hypothetical protein